MKVINIEVDHDQPASRHEHAFHVSIKVNVQSACTAFVPPPPQPLKIFLPEPTLDGVQIPNLHLATSILP